MPRSVLANLDVDYSVAMADMGIVLQDLVQRPADMTRERPFDLLLEAGIAERYVNDDKNAITAMDIEQSARELDRLGDRSPLSCPDCGGALWRMKQGAQERYRCHLGHAYNVESMLGRNRESLEESLWVALRSLEERKYVLTTLAEEMGERNPATAGAYHQRAEELHLHVERIRQVLLSFNDARISPPDAASPLPAGR
jgi:two-component system chemotaxis response regulator CheB